MLAYETEALATEAEAETKSFSVETEGQDKDVQSRGRGETEAFEISTEARPRRGTTAPRDGLETEASRPRPHPCKTGIQLAGSSLPLPPSSIVLLLPPLKMLCFYLRLSVCLSACLLKRL